MLMYKKIVGNADLYHRRPSDRTSGTECRFDLVGLKIVRLAFNP